MATMSSHAARALPQGLPTAAQLFAFAADAESRIHTLRARIEERATTANGISRVDTEIFLARPRVRITTIRREGPGSGDYDLWSTDGSIVDQYSSATNTRTRRPVRRAPEGIDDRELPNSATIDTAHGPLPAKSWATTMLRPANFCVTVLATATLGEIGEATIAGRAALEIDAAAPRAVGLEGDRADFRYRVAFDRITGAILAIEELRGERVVRNAVTTAFNVDEAMPDAALTPEIPSNAVAIY